MFNANRITTTMLTLIAVSPAALAHNHITIDTASGSSGDRILLKAGYYPTESAFSIVEGRLRRSRLTACYSLPDTFVAGPILGWFGGDEALLTSDYFFPTGRLSGGDFRWELVSVTPVLEGSSIVDWGAFDESGDFVVMAASDGATRTARSFATPAGNHNHEQAYGFKAAGLFDVTFVVWDASGKFADSDLLAIRFRAGPPCPSDLDADGLVEDSDFVIFVVAYNILDCEDPAMPFECPADLNSDGFVDDADFVLFVQSYDALLCPTV